MRTGKFCAGATLLLVALFLDFPRVARAQEEEANTPTPQSSAPQLSDSAKELSSGSGKDVIVEQPHTGSDVGTGNFGKLPFHVTVEVREGYDDNVYTTAINPVGSFFTNGSILLDYKFGSPRTTFDLQAVAGATYYYNRPFGQQYDVNSSLTFALEHHATPRLTLSASAYLTYQSEPDFFNTQFGINRVGGNFFYTADKLSLGYQWSPRFSTVTSYSLGAIHYDESAIGSYENRFEHTFGNEFRFLVLPTTTVVGEYRYEIVNYEEDVRDSTTHFFLAGVDHTFNPRFNVSVRGGVEFRDINDFGERTSPYGEMTLRYAAGHRTNISWMTRYGLEEPDVPGTPSRTTFRTGLTVAFGISPRVTALGTLFYEHDDNESVETNSFVVPAFDEDLFDIGIALRFDINRIFAAIAGYDHTEVFSDIALRQYSRNRYYLGVSAKL